MSFMAVDDRRITIRVAASDYARLEAAAAGAGVSVGGLIREAALRACTDTAREVAAGRLSLRRANGLEVVAGPRDVAQRPVPAPDPFDRARRFRQATQAAGAHRSRGG